MEIFMNLITQLFQNISGTIRNVLQRTRGSSLCGEDEELGGGTRPLLDSDASSTHSDDNRSNDIGRHQSLQKLVSRDRYKEGGSCCFEFSFLRLLANQTNDRLFLL